MDEASAITAAAVMAPTAISLGASPAAAMSSPDGDLQRSKVPKVGIDIGELKPLEGNVDRPSALDKAKMWDRTKHDPVTVPTPAEPPSPKEDLSRLGLDKQSFAELIEQARADLDCDVGMRDMMFDPESDVCDALTLVQIRYENELDRIASDYDKTPSIDGVSARHSCDGISEIAYGAVSEHCEALDHARQTYIAEIDRIVSDQTSPVTPESPCSSGAEEFELHVQPDGSSLPGADICVWGSDEAAIAAPTEPQFGVQCFDQDRVSGGVGEIPCQPYLWHPQPGQEIKPRCSVDDWFSDEPWHDSYCEVDYDHHRDESVWSNSPGSDWSDPSEPSTSNTSGFDTLT